MGWIKSEAAEGWQMKGINGGSLMLQAFVLEWVAFTCALRGNGPTYKYKVLLSDHLYTIIIIIKK